jgi:hypothetical protein
MIEVPRCSTNETDPLVTCKPLNQRAARKRAGINLVYDQQEYDWDANVSVTKHYS